MSIEILPVPVPVDEEPDWMIRGLAEVERAEIVAVLGDDDLADTPRQRAINLANQRTAIKEWFVAVATTMGQDPAAVLGAAWLFLPTKDNTHSASVDLVVHPDHRRRGIGTRLWERILERVRHHGRRTVVASTAHSEEPPEGAEYALGAPTGSGRVDARDAGVAFVRSRGFELEQVERHSIQRLPVPEHKVRSHLEAARQAAGPDYDLVTWSEAVPQEWISELAALLVAMSIDIPHGQLEMEQETWDAERIRIREEQVRKFGRRTYTTAVRHIPTGTLAGYTQVEVSAEKPEMGFQENTLVLSTHRGHRLGMLLKAANLQWLQQAEPALRRIHTWNAQENDHMLSINVALGYRVASVWGAWQRKLDRTEG